MCDAWVLVSIGLLLPAIPQRPYTIDLIRRYDCQQRPSATAPVPMAGALPSAIELIVTVLPSTSACPGIRPRQIVVEIVDVSSPEFHKVQQVRFF